MRTELMRDLAGSAGAGPQIEPRTVFVYIKNSKIQILDFRGKRSPAFLRHRRVHEDLDFFFFLFV